MAESTLPTSEGHYFYTDDMPGARPRPIHVTEVNGSLWAAFRDKENGGLELIRVEDMAGTFTPTK